MGLITKAIVLSKGLSKRVSSSWFFIFNAFPQVMGDKGQVPVTDSDVVLILGPNRLKVEVDELMLPKGFNTNFVEIWELPQSGKSNKY